MWLKPKCKVQMVGQQKARPRSPKTPKPDPDPDPDPEESKPDRYYSMLRYDNVSR